MGDEEVNLCVIELKSLAEIWVKVSSSFVSPVWHFYYHVTS